jgi:hypothetical protein
MTLLRQEGQQALALVGHGENVSGHGRQPLVGVEDRSPSLHP